MSKADLSQADTHFYQMILVTPGMKRGFPMFSQSTSASSLSSDRSELTLPHQLSVGMCRPQQLAPPSCLSGDPQSLLRFLSGASPQRPVGTCSAKKYLLYLFDNYVKGTTQLAVAGDEV